MTGRPDPAKVTKKIVSAGGVVLGDGDKVLVLRRKVEGTWVLPKGRREEGETLQETALREVKEETGISELDVKREIGVVRYTFYWRPDDVNFKKTVHYYLMTIPDGNGDIELEPDFSEFKWVDFEEALKTLTFENDRRIVRGVLKG